MQGYINVIAKSKVVQTKYQNGILSSFEIATDKECSIVEV